MQSSLGDRLGETENWELERPGFKSQLYPLLGGWFGTNEWTFLGLKLPVCKMGLPHTFWGCHEDEMRWHLHIPTEKHLSPPSSCSMGSSYTCMILEPCFVSTHFYKAGLTCGLSTNYKLAPLLMNILYISENWLHRGAWAWCGAQRRRNTTGSRYLALVPENFIMGSRLCI